jgi:hypothetical protein
MNPDFDNESDSSSVELYESEGTSIYSDTDEPESESEEFESELLETESDSTLAEIYSKKIDHDTFEYERGSHADDPLIFDHDKCNI